MAPKSSTTAKERLVVDDEEILQAVVLADSFNKRFAPLTRHKPRVSLIASLIPQLVDLDSQCLLPICNAPLLDWTFESLALAGVQEIFVICRSHAELVKAAIKSASSPTSSTLLTHFSWPSFTE